MLAIVGMSLGRPKIFAVGPQDMIDIKFQEIKNATDIAKAQSHGFGGEVAFYDLEILPVIEELK